MNMSLFSYPVAMLSSYPSRVPQNGAFLPISLAVLLLLFMLVRCLRIVPQATVFIVERLGAYKASWQTGVHLKLPFFERVALRVSLKEQVADFQPQAVITKDNVTMEIDTVVFFQITDPKLFAYGIENPILAIENLSATTLRNIIGDLELDETLTSRDIINSKMRTILDEATDPWGIKVNRVELKNILPPREIQNAMERQMKAEREKREKILIAEGKAQSDILEAEGQKKSVILRADAKRESEILEARGHAEAMLMIAKAKAEALELIKKVAPDRSVLALRGLEALEKVADGRATKLIVPSELQNLTSLLASAKLSLGEEEQAAREAAKNEVGDFEVGQQPSETEASLFTEK